MSAAARTREKLSATRNSGDANAAGDPEFACWTDCHPIQFGNVSRFKNGNNPFETLTNQLMVSPDRRHDCERQVTEIFLS
jgi:hypothetical protein